MGSGWKKVKRGSLREGIARHVPTKKFKYLRTQVVESVVIME
jgi:hypothetical protein